MNITVVIPTYNRCELLRRAVDSVANQTIEPLETVIVDDGSTDRTRQFLGSIKSDSIVPIRTGHKGVSAARNTGIAAARGDWVAFLDSDDWWAPEKLERQRQFHDSNEDLCLSQTEETWIRNGVRVNPRKHHRKPEGWVFRQCLRRCLISPSAVIINMVVFKTCGLFDETLPACEDYDLWLRIARRFKIGLLREPLVFKTGGHTDQLSTTHWGLDRFRLRALEKHLEKGLNDGDRRACLKTMVQKAGIVANGSQKRGERERAAKYARLQKHWSDLLELE